MPPMGDPPTHPFSKSQNYRTISEQASASLKTEIGPKIAENRIDPRVWEVALVVD